MPSFPLFVPLEGRRVLVIGAGQVASRKIEKLLAFGPRLDVVAKAASDEVLAWAREGKVRLLVRPYAPADLEGAELVVVAVDDLALQRQVYEACVARRVPVNAVDSPAWCTFTFPALVVQGDVTFGVSTGGRAPGLAAGLRAWLEDTLPPGLGEVARRVGALRGAAEVRALERFDHRAGRVGDEVRRLLEAWARRAPLPPEGGPG